MEKLQQLANISQLSRRVCRVLGQNPGSFTLQGTNTYLIGDRPPFILIDTGEGKPSYLPLLEDALRTRHKSGGGQRVASFSDIIITHHHHDHFGGLRDVVNLSKRLWDEGSAVPSADAASDVYKPPRVYKLKADDYSSETSGPTMKEENEDRWKVVMSSLDPGSVAGFGTLDLSVSHEMAPSQVLETKDGSCTLSFLHTPGHTPDSIALYLHEEHILFSADTVLGHGTAVFEDLGAYITSLRKLLDLREGGKWTFQNIYPAHGPVVEDGPALIKKYIDHRMEREQQIVELLREGSGESEESQTGSWSIRQLVSVIYKAYPENLWVPAAHSVELHLRKLQAEGVVTSTGGDGMESRWMLIAEL